MTVVREPCSDLYECTKEEGKHWKHYIKWVQRSLKKQNWEKSVKVHEAMEEEKVFTEKLQKLWWARDMLNFGCLKIFLSNSDENLQWCMENVKWLQYWNNNVILKRIWQERKIEAFSSFFRIKAKNPENTLFLSKTSVFFMYMVEFSSE